LSFWAETLEANRIIAEQIKKVLLIIGLLLEQLVNTKQSSRSLHVNETVMLRRHNHNH
jgi:hypothetical protein